MTLLLLAAPVGAAAPRAQDAPAAPTPASLQTSLLDEVDDDPCDGVTDAAYTDRDQARAEHLAGIDCATWRGIVEGSTVNDRLVYRPRVSVSRGELATFIAHTLIAAGYEHRLDDGEGTPEFRDIAGHPDEQRINQLARAGIITGDPDGRYQPNAAVHREEVATYLVRAYEWALEVELTSASSSHFADVPASSVHAAAINAGFEQDLLSGTAPGRFSPRRSVAREEMATLSVNLLRAVWTDDDGLNVLAARARALIAYVEASELPCETRTQIVRRLRLLHDAIESGQRTAAQGLLIAWMQDARTSISSGLLTPEQGATLHARMDDVLTQIGDGSPEHPRPTPHWQPLPSCDAGAVMATSYNPEIADFGANDALLIMQGMVGMVPFVGPMLASFTALLWPAGPDQASALEPLIDKKLDDLVEQDLKNELKGLGSLLSDFKKTVSGWKNDCGELGEKWTPPSKWDDPSTWGDKSDMNWCYIGAYDTWDDWKETNKFFLDKRAKFQGSDEDQVMLLPLFAQYENLYLVFIREGILLERFWSAAGGISPTARAVPRQLMTIELDPEPTYEEYGTWELPYVDVGISYVDATYSTGLEVQPEATNPANWTIRNAYLRDMTLYVLGFRDMWQYLDPIAYPAGAPDIKLTRMVYSDIPSEVQDWSNFHEPANVPGPLTRLSIWAEDVAPLSHGSTRAIEAMQSTSPPTAGPVKVGPVTGDTNLDEDYPGKSNAHFLDLTASGPIVTVETRADALPWYKNQIPSGVRLTYARGGSSSFGDMSHGENPQTFHYPGYVLATATALGTYDLRSAGAHSADTLVFGFRRADSFAPSASLVGVGSGKCINMPAWADGTQATIYACHGGANQIWSYNPATKQLLATGTKDLPSLLVTGERNLQATGKCLTAGGTDLRSPVVIRDCTGKADQEWELVPKGNGQGLIMAAQSRLVLDVYDRLTANGTTIQLATATAATNQLWKLPDPLVGQVHSIRTGRCFGVKDKSTANGATVHMWTCQPPGDTAVNERWTYDGATKAFTVYGGAKCLEAAGSTRGSGLMIWDCTGAPTQQWTINADRTITGVQSGLVLDVASGGTANGTKLQLWTKTSDLRNQMWSRPNEQGGALHALGAGKCLMLPSWFQGIQAVIATCAARDASQTWTYHPMTQQFTAYSGATTFCLGADPTGTVTIGSTCSNDPSQQWRLVRRADGVSGAIQNAASGRCMTLNDTTGGSTIGLRDCFEKDAKPPMDPTIESLQQWVWSP